MGAINITHVRVLQANTVRVSLREFAGDRGITNLPGIAGSRSHPVSPARHLDRFDTVLAGGSCWTTGLAGAGQSMVRQPRIGEVLAMKRISWRWILVCVLLLVWLLVRYIDKQMSQALIRKGGAHLQAKEYPQAVEAFSRAIEIDRKSAEAYHGRAMAYLHQREPDRALADLDEALRLAPGDARVTYNRGSACVQKEDYDRALAEFGEAIRLDPGFAKAYQARGRVHAKKGDAARAKDDLQKAAELDPSVQTSGDGDP